MTDMYYLHAAHKAAYEQCDSIHRDVSVGNILIFPTILTAQGRKFVYWVGLLCDWELAKDIKLKVARQPERTVCCSMSLRSTRPDPCYPP